MFVYESVKYYENNPFIQFLDSLNQNEQADIFAAIDKLIEFKNSSQRVPVKLSKYLNNGIFELRVNHLNRISRSLYFFVKDNKIVFTNGFIKKQQKTPKSEIEKAIRLKKHYLTDYLK